MIQTVIFDLDGIIIDSEPIHFKLEKQMLDELQIAMSYEEHNSYVGMSSENMWKTINQIKTSPVRSLKFVNSNQSFAGKKMWTDQFPQISYPSGSNVNIRLTGLKLDEVILCGISGELMTEIGLQVKKESPYRNTIIITHCNGLSGYICTDKAFTEGGYEPKVSHLMPGIEQQLVKKCLEMIHSF